MTDGHTVRQVEVEAPPTLQVSIKTTSFEMIKHPNLSDFNIFCEAFTSLSEDRHTGSFF